MAGSQAGRTLYRQLLKRVAQLPPANQQYYKDFVRQGFASHADEDDVERLAQISDRALKDADWVVAKYKAEASNEEPPKPIS
eukprot:m.69010 g.69010  ORF g.69010 m.69010 type:complete len:82 (+) comp8555_c0_seq2:64-309(+)